MKNTSFAYEVFESTPRGKVLQSLEIIIVGGVMSLLLFFLFIKPALDVDGSMGALLFLVVFGLIVCLFVIAQLLLPGLSFVVRLFPPTFDEIMAYQAKRLKELNEQLGEERRHHERRVHSITEEIRELLQN